MWHCDCPLCCCRRRRGAMVAYYVGQFGLSEEEADAALAIERQLMKAAAVAHISERHGLDDDDAVSVFLIHAINPPEMIQ